VIRSLLVLFSALQVACASTQHAVRGDAAPLQQRLEFENASATAVHVFMRVNGTLFKSGYAPPSGTIELDVPASPFSEVSVVVVPVERLAAFRSSPDPSGVYASQAYPLEALLAHSWRFTGNSLMGSPMVRLRTMR
jgi:hypothetical protein